MKADHWPVSHKAASAPEGVSSLLHKDTQTKTNQENMKAKTWDGENANSELKFPLTPLLKPETWPKLTLCDIRDFFCLQGISRAQTRHEEEKGTISNNHILLRNIKNDHTHFRHQCYMFK